MSCLVLLANKKEKRRREKAAAEEEAHRYELLFKKKTYIEINERRLETTKMIHLVSETVADSDTQCHHQCGHANKRGHGEVLE